MATTRSAAAPAPTRLFLFLFYLFLYLDGLVIRYGDAGAYGERTYDTAAASGVMPARGGRVVQADTLYVALT
jgi:hypothetical protein